MLTALGYLEGDEVTERGARLMRLYGEMDLLASESLRAGSGRACRPPSWPPRCPRWSSRPAARRRRGAPAARRAAQGVLAEMVALWADLDALEQEHKLDFLREPDLGFAWAAYRWAEGASLDEVLLARPTWRPATSCAG